MRSQISIQHCNNYADDEEWRRRYERRTVALLAVHRSEYYITVINMLATGVLSTDDLPAAPDPADRSCSKRQWERTMQAYRQCLQICAERAAQ